MFNLSLNRLIRDNRQILAPGGGNMLLLGKEQLQGDIGQNKIVM